MEIFIATLLIYSFGKWEVETLPFADSNVESESMPHSEDYYAGYIKALADNYENIFSSNRGTRSADNMESVSTEKADEASKPESIGKQVNADSAAPSAETESVATDSSTATAQKAANLEPSDQMYNQESGGNSSVATKSEPGQYASNSEADNSPVLNKEKSQEQLNPSLSDGQTKENAENEKDESSQEVKGSIGTSKKQNQPYPGDQNAYPGDHSIHTEQVVDSQGDASDTKTEEPPTPAALSDKNITDDIRGDTVNQTFKVSSFIKNENDDESDTAESGSGEESVRDRLIESFSKKSTKSSSLETSRDIHRYEGNQELEDMRKRNSEDNDIEDTKKDTVTGTNTNSKVPKRGDQTNSTSKVISGSYASYTPGDPSQQPKQNKNPPPHLAQPQQQNQKRNQHPEHLGTKKNNHEKMIVYGNKLPSVINIPSRQEKPFANIPDNTAPKGQGYLLEHTYGTPPLFNSLLPYNAALSSPYSSPVLPFGGSFGYSPNSISYPDSLYNNNNYFYGGIPNKKGDVPIEMSGDDEEDTDEASGQSEESETSEVSEKSQREKSESLVGNGNSGSKIQKTSNERKTQQNGQQWQPSIILLAPTFGSFGYGSYYPTGNPCGCECNCGCNSNCGCGCGCSGCTCMSGQCGCNENNRKTGGKQAEKNRNQSGKGNGNDYDEDNDDCNECQGCCGCQMNQCGCPSIIGAPIPVYPPPQLRIPSGYDIYNRYNHVYDAPGYRYSGPIVRYQPRMSYHVYGSY